MCTHSHENSTGNRVSSHEYIVSGSRLRKITNFFFRSRLNDIYSNILSDDGTQGRSSTRKNDFFRRHRFQEFVTDIFWNFPATRVQTPVSIVSPLSSSIKVYGDAIPWHPNFRNIQTNYTTLYIIYSFVQKNSNCFQPLKILKIYLFITGAGVTLPQQQYKIHCSSSTTRSLKINLRVLGVLRVPKFEFVCTKLWKVEYILLYHISVCIISKQKYGPQQ